jgi:glycosyltransferase involved in cell wall biosynthesis
VNANPKVSVIIPSFNYGHFLADALNAVASQTFSDWECIVVDDGSTDKTRELVEMYVHRDARFRYMFQENRGLAGARNSGLRLARGTLIQLLDADDVILPGKLATQVAFLEKNSRVDLVFGDVYRFDRTIDQIDRAERVTLKAMPRNDDLTTMMSELLDDNFFLVHCALFRKSAADQVGWFDESMNTCEDWNYWFRMLAGGYNFMYDASPESRVFVRAHGANMSGARQNMWRGKILFYERVTTILDGIATEGAVRLADLRKKNSGKLKYYEMCYGFRYGNMFRGIVSFFSTLYFTKKFYSTVYDGVYWIKERLMKRV